MRALPRIPTAAPHRDSVAPGYLVLLALVWAILAVSATSIGQSEAENRDHLAPRTDALVLQEAAFGVRPALGSAGKAPGAWAASGTIPAEPPPARPLQQPAADASIPVPARFTGFSYRTTGPPPRNG